ncbi:type II toxin-antitoxin system Phd/YefM family antitoxin [Mycolicibacter acidiphilus]|nr:type II toxin-antitoxin system prevent-host-death family antitoxin [Mycolicibacter acidiphilus]
MSSPADGYNRIRDNRHINGRSVMEVGVRELRDQLSRHLAEVREGRTVTVTDHGHPIARIVPVLRPTKLEQLRAEGRVQHARTRKQPAPAPLTTTGTVSDLISEQRG